MKKVLIVLVILIVLAVLGGGGYLAYQKFVKKDSSASVTGLLGGRNLNPNCKYKDPDLCKFINGWKENKYYTVTDNSTAKDGKKAKMIFKMAGEDRTQMTFYEGDKESMNTISIGNTTYTKDYADNKWWKQTYKPEETKDNTSEPSYDFDDKADKAEDNTSYKKIGKEACGKYTCFKYQVIDPANTESTQYIYFDDKEYQLRKMRDEGKDGTISESTFDYSKISIKEPSPTKEGSPYGNLGIPTGTAVPTAVPTSAARPTVAIPTEAPATEAPAEETPAE